MAHASRSALQLTAIALALSSIGAQAQTYTWANDTDTNPLLLNWSLPTNWSPLGPPAQGGDVVITVTGVKTITHNAGNDSINTLNFEATTPNPNAVLLVNSGSSLNVASGGANGGVLRADNGTMAFTGGTLLNKGTLDTINNGSITFSSATLAGGTITGGSGGSVHFTNSATIDGLSNGAVTNNGNVIVNSGANVYAQGVVGGTGIITQQDNTDLRINNGQSLTLSGTGSLTMTAGNSRIFSNDGTGTLTNAAGHTIQGVGQISLNNTKIVNAGVITANVNGQTLVIDPIDGEGGLVNSGTLRAENGGNLQLNASNYNNQTGTIAALTGSAVSLSNATIQGGLLTTTGTGTITAINSSLLDGNTHGAITNTGNLIIGSGQAIYAQGLLIDNHGITQQDNSDFRINSGQNLTLSGSGSLTMQAGNSRVYSYDGTGTLTNSAGYTIQGLGQVGLNNTKIVNAGVITANVANATLTIDPIDGEGGLVNTGTLRAENGGNLQLNTSNYNNQAGTIAALNGSAVSLSNATIQGGLLTTTGTGTITGINSSLLDGSTHGAITNTGNLIIGSGQVVFAQGSLIDNHGITQQDNTDFRINGGQNLTLSGSGSLTMQAGNSRVYSSDGMGTLTNSASYTIQGLGQVGVNATKIVNAGVITANVNGQTLAIDPIDGEGGLVNTGMLRAENGGNLQLNTSNYNNQAGTIAALTGSAVSLSNATIQGGLLTTTGTGTITAINSSLLDGNTHGAITNTGNLIIGSGQVVFAQGSLIDNHGITQQDNTDFRINGGQNLTLSGSGSLTMQAGNSRVYSSDGMGTLTNSASYTIQGLGQVGVNATKIVNAGVITANVANATLTIDPIDGEGGLVNTGMLRAENGGNLQLNTSNYNNAGGSIAALDHSVVSVNNAVVQGGLLTSAGSGTISFTNSATLDGTTHGAITNTGSVTIASGANVYAQGSIVDKGTITQQDNTDLHINSGTDLNLSGTGVYSMQAGNSRIFSNDGTGTLINGAGHTIQGLGQIGVNQTAVTNAGTINANVSGQTLNLVTNSAVVNQSTGILAASNGGTLYIDKAVTGTGTIRTDSGGTVQLNQAAQTGQLINNANLAIGTNNVTVSADYNNANFGTGNTFNKRAGISGTGSILASGDVAQAITGTTVANGTSGTPTLTIGNVRVGGTTYNYQVANTGTSGPSIRGAIETSVNGGNITDSRLSGTGVTAGNYGPVGTGANSGNLGITFTATTAGALAPLSGQAVHIANNFDNVAEQTLGIVLASGAAAYNAAVGSTTPTPVNIANQRVNGNGSQALTVANSLASGQSATYTEALNASISGMTGSATSNGGSVSNIAAGTSNTGGLVVGVDATTAGAKTGSVTIAYQSDGTGSNGHSGLSAISAGSQVINVSGSVYNTATGSTTPTPVLIANQRVSGTNSQALTVTNALANGQSATYTEALNASIGGTTGTATGSGGPITNLGAGTSNNGALSVGVNTTSSGAKTGVVTIAYQSDGTGTNGHSGLSAISAGSQAITVSGNVYQAAAGTLITPAFNFGVFQVGQTVGTSQTLSIQNSATGAAGYVEDLNASFGAITGTGANKVTATGSFTGLAAGATNSSALTVGVNTSSAGTVNANIAVNYVSAGTVNGVGNGLGTFAVGSSSYGVAGTIQGMATVVNQADPIINNSPIPLGNVRIGSTSPTGFVSVTNQVNGTMQAGLNASISGNGPVTAAGSFNQLAPGSTNNSSLAVGFDTSSAGSKNGTATIAFVSDSSNQGCTSNCQMQLASQDVSVTGAVYRLASPSVTTGPITVAARVNATGPTTTIGITNASTDGYTEALTATRGATSAGFTSSGGITNLVAGGSSTAIGVTLNTAMAGTFTGTQALNFVSSGTGTDNAADYALNGQSVTLNGKVYTPAAATLNTQSVNFNIVHVNDTVTAQSVYVTNSGAASALNDTLVSSAVGASGPFTASGNLGSAGLGVGQTSSANALTVSLNTRTAGTYSGSATFSAASHDSDLTDAALANLAVSLVGQVNNYASDTFSKTSGGGTLSQSGSTFILDYGTVAQGSGTVTSSLVATNSATGPADVLAGNFQFMDAADFGEMGFGAFTGLMAGMSDGPLSFSFSSATLGSFMDTIVLHGVGSNASGYAGGIGDITLIVRGTVDAMATPPNGNVPEPDSLLLLGLGLPLLFVRRRRTQRPH